jgi:hypothetical protein
MSGLHIIQGKPVLGANLLATLIKNDRRYNYQVVELTDTACEIAFYEQGHEIGRSRFTADDARKAGTKNLDKYPRNMLFARAISNGAKWYVPGIFGGAPIYTPEDFDMTVNEDGEIIEAETVVIQVREEIFAEDKNSPLLMPITEAEATTNSKGQAYGDLDDNQLSFILNGIQKAFAKDITDERRAELEFKRDAALTILRHRNS